MVANVKNADLCFTVLAVGEGFAGLRVNVCFSSCSKLVLVYIMHYSSFYL